MLSGYSDRIHARPGDTIKFFVSCETQYRARILRIICGDTNPDGPGIKETHIPTGIDGAYPGRIQTIHAGSYITVPHAPALENLESFRISTHIWPTTPALGRRQTIIAKWDGKTGAGFRLMIDESGCLVCEIGNAGTSALLSTHRKLLARRWYHIGAGFDLKTNILSVFQHPLLPVPSINDAATAEQKIPINPAATRAPLTFAASLTAAGEATAHYNGKIDNPEISSTTLIAAYDFSIEMHGQTAYDTGPHQLHGAVINFPARAMTGHDWRAETMDFKADPSQWSAIHFHDDDIYDAAWESDFSLTVPATMKSGLYAAHLTTELSEEYIPFAIGPEPGAERSIAFLLPTASYLAYGNDRLAIDGGGAELLDNCLNIIGPHDIFLNEHPEYGGSLYDAHSDGSGICHSSRLRPLLNMRPKVQGLLGGFSGSKLWQFPADTHITDFLEATGFEFDVITDEELNERGHELLAPYRAVITGTHPEYYSAPMWHALNDYRNNGGRLMYLGGNGFYWRIAYHPTCPGIIELRRGESGVRAWQAAPGETFHAFDGAQGGIWARLGRPPQSLAGVGFSCQGFDISGHYQRLPDSYLPAAEFIFANVGNEPIGDFGLIAGGAAGLELDRAAPELGTPPNTMILATSRNIANSYLIVPEEFLETAPGLGADENPLARADMVFFTLPNGGAVFSTGSIAWAGSLFHQNYTNNVATITANVLRRFISDEGF
jgi:N,N-dimethylformamidase